MRRLDHINTLMVGAVWSCVCMAYASNMHARDEWASLTLVFSPTHQANAEFDQVIILLRPREWVTEQKIRIGQEIDLVVPEFDTHGVARVLAVHDGVVSYGTSGQLVTATMEASADDVQSITLESQGAPINATSSHPVYSESRKRWVCVDQLQIGEHLRSEACSTMRVKTKRIMPGRHRVFNIEVTEDHDYYVGESSILTHNKRFVMPARLRFRKRPVLAAGRPWDVILDQHDRLALDTNVMLNLVGRYRMPSVIRYRAGYSIAEFKHSYIFIKEARERGVELILPRAVLREVRRGGIDLQTIKAWMEGFDIKMGGLGDAKLARYYRDIGLDPRDAWIMSSVSKDNAALVTFDQRTILRPLILERQRRRRARSIITRALSQYSGMP